MDYPRRPDSAVPGARRVFTAPTYGGPSSEQMSPAADGGSVETLYNHPSVKIVAFNAGPRPVFSHGKGVAPPAEIEPGSLPWSSQMERTIAAGQFRIYRAPGSVAFLSCGSALQPILPKSQCWCIDEQSSKYVLQIRRPQYWRIEVPVGSQDEARRALELRGVMDQILQFEKTECPFKRGFTVELPERPQTPVKKRPWTPVSRRSSSAFLPPTPVTPEVAPTHKPKEEAPKNHHTQPTVGSQPAADETSLSTTRKPEDSGHQTTVVPREKADGSCSVASTVEGAVSALEHIARAQTGADTTHVHPSLPKPAGFHANRSVTAPPQLTLVTAPALNPVSAGRVLGAVPVPETEPSESRSPTDSSGGSFHSVETWSSAGVPLPPSPPLTASGSPTVTPFPEQYLYLPKKAHRQAGADLTITPNTPRTLTTRSPDEEAEAQHDNLATGTASVQDLETASICSVQTAGETLQPFTSTTGTELSPAPTPSNPYVPQPASTTTARATSSSTTTSSSTVLTGRPYMRHRPTASSSISPSRGALNRLPSAADLFPTYRTSSHSSSSARPKPPPSRLSLVRSLPKAIIHKTIEILLSPPSHLVDLMLKVAARIAAGEWRGYVFGFGEGGERIPVRWDWSDGDDDGEGELGGWGADEDWEFDQTTQRRRRRSSAAPRMAGAYPDSPEEEVEADRQVGLGEEGGEAPTSPSLERARRARGERRKRAAEWDNDKRKDPAADANADGNADWTGSLSID